VHCCGPTVKAEKHFNAMPGFPLDIRNEEKAFS